MTRETLYHNRAKRTIQISGFNSKLTSKRLLEELFTQGGPIRDVTLLENHAYILFEHEESVPYCLALFDDIELHGRKLLILPKLKTKDAFRFKKHLKKVRSDLMSEFNKIPPPNLPPRIMPSNQAGKYNVNNKSVDKSPSNYKENKLNVSRRSDNYQFAGVKKPVKNNKGQQNISHKKLNNVTPSKNTKKATNTNKGVSHKKNLGAKKGSNTKKSYNAKNASDKPKRNVKNNITKKHKHKPQPKKKPKNN